MHQPAFVETVVGDVATPEGFSAAGVHCGLKRARPDLALIYSEAPATCAGVFTTNRVQAAPILYSRDVVRRGRARALVANSGNANACTGPQGRRDAVEMAELTAASLSLPPDEVLVASTGVIGVPLRMDPIRTGIPAAVAALGGAGGRVAEALLTTDTVTKTFAARLHLPSTGSSITLGGIAKGAGMIHPDMATTLCFLTTDAGIDAEPLQGALRTAIEASFNRITVDGDTSTNDCVLLLANGASGHRLTDEESVASFTEGLTFAATELAKMVVRDGEGATKLIEVVVEGARTDEEAKRAAFTVAQSLLVKTAMHGGEPNWGRILPAVGRSGVAMEEGRMAVWYNDLQVVEAGLGVTSDLGPAAAELRQKEVQLRVDLGLGEGRASVWTCDLSAEYVRINGSYIS